MTTVITLACVAAYLVGSVLFARGRLRHWHKNSTLYDHDDPADRVFYALAALALGLFWPIVLAFLKVVDWLWKPVDRAEERREQMVQDRESWRQRARTATDERERVTAVAIVETLDDLLKESR